MIKQRWLFLTACILVSTPALAADVVLEPPAPAVEEVPQFTWTGPYIGAAAGYGWGKSDLDSDFGSMSFDPDGFLGGVYAGYNYQFSNNVVLGIEADIDYSDMNGDDEVGIISGDSELQWQGSVRARLGYAMDRVLPYITGGVAFGNYEHSITDGVDGFSDDDTYVGWTVGAGIEYAITDNWIMRGEYRYTDFGDQDFDFAGADYNVDLKTHALKLGISYKF